MVRRNINACFSNADEDDDDMPGGVKTGGEKALAGEGGG